MIRHLLILGSLIFALQTAHAEDAKQCWYVVVTKQIMRGESYRYIGASPLSAEELAKRLGAQQPLVLDQVMTWMNGRFTLWSDFDKNSLNQIILMPDNVLSLMPLKGDPRQLPVDPAAKPPEGDPSKF